MEWSLRTRCFLLASEQSVGLVTATVRAGHGYCGIPQCGYTRIGSMFESHLDRVMRYRVEVGVLPCSSCSIKRPQRFFFSSPCV